MNSGPRIAITPGDSRGIGPEVVAKALATNEPHMVCQPGVVGMCNDQGLIAIKTWGFVGNCAMFLGAPYLFMCVGHGTAFDIVGRGVANHEMTLAAILQGVSLACGRGFLD